MICTNCGNPIEKAQDYYRLKNKSPVLCSHECVYDAYKGFYSTKYIRKNITEYIRWFS